MGQPMFITYHFHSGFSVSCDKTLLVFDYWRGEKKEIPRQAEITQEMLRGYEKVYVFISHEHPDHLDEVVYTWRNFTNVTYIISDDMSIGVQGKRMASGQTLSLAGGIVVKAFDSTDMGVSFLVQFGDMNIFHAGDLNYWHWQNESTAAEIEQAEQEFNAAIRKIEGEKIDVAFFPVDSRQGPNFDAGANYFILALRPKLLLPMHFWGRGDVAADFAIRAKTRRTQVMALKQPGEQLRLEKDEKGMMTVTLMTRHTGYTTRSVRLNPVAEYYKPAEVKDVKLNTYEGSDPFMDTDLPVALDEKKKK